MKIKITVFVFNIILMISTVSCVVDSKYMNPNDMIPPIIPLVPLELEPEFEVGEIPIYTEEEEEQVRQSLIGRYQGVLDNQEAIFAIEPYNNNSVFFTVSIIINGVESTDRCSILFLIRRTAMLVFEENTNVYGFYLGFSSDNDTQVISIFSAINNLVGSLNKVENYQEASHDEL